MRVVCLSLAMGLFFSSAVYATEIGRTTVNGRSVILDSAGTWAYADEAGATAGAAVKAGCDLGNNIASKKLPISVCLTQPWRVDNSPSSAMELQATHPDLDLYVGLITERTEMPLATLREAILYNAANASGIKTEDVPVLKESVESLNNQSWNYIEYEVVISGAKFRFGDYHKSLGELGVVQMAFWAPAAYFEQSKPAMVAMMNGVKLDTP
jgi:hypothetical protein